MEVISKVTNYSLILARNYKIAMANLRTSQCQDGDEKLNVMNEDVRAIKDALESLNTRKSTSRRILTGILSKNSEPKPNLSSKLLREWSSRSIRSRVDISEIHLIRHP